MKILVVEDDGMVALLLEDALGEAGHEVVGPVDAADQAKALASAHKPDLMLVDINLKDGETGCSLARDAQHSLGVPTIFVTGSPEKAERCAAALGVLVKPFHADSVVATVEVAAAMAAGRVPAYIPQELQLF